MGEQKRMTGDEIVKQLRRLMERDYFHRIHKSSTRMHKNISLESIYSQPDAFQPNWTIPSAEWFFLCDRVEQTCQLDFLELEHKRRLEYARIEHERRMEVIEAEAVLLDERCRRLAEQIAPSNARLDALAGTFSAAPGTFDDEEMPY